MSDTSSVDEKQIWTALFGVSSFLYRITERAPERDPLRWHLQDIAVRLLRETSASAFGADRKSVEGPQSMIRELLAVSELLHERSWADSATMQALSKYTWQLRSVLDQCVKSVVVEKEDSNTTTTRKKASRSVQSARTAETHEPTMKTTRRQERIVDILSEVEGHVAPASFFAEAFPGVTARTIRRDLQTLVERGTVTQEGSGRGAQYRLPAEEAMRTH